MKAKPLLTLELMARFSSREPSIYSVGTLSERDCCWIVGPEEISGPLAGTKMANQLAFPLAPIAHREKLLQLSNRSILAWEQSTKKERRKGRIMNAFAAILNERMAELNIGAEELAEKSGVQLKMMLRIVSGQALPGKPLTSQLSDILSLDADATWQLNDSERQLLKQTSSGE